MSINYLALLDYCEDNCTEQDELFYQLERETHLKTLAPQMISGKLQGQFFTFLATIMNAKSILEIGTFTGYATLAFAKGMLDDGRITTIEVNKELDIIAEKYRKLSGQDHKIKALIGDAHTIIPSLEESYDIIFLDAGKRDYLKFYDLLIPKLKVGGVLLADNVLWSGKVTREAIDLDTKAIHKFNQHIKDDKRVSNIILPVRDGLMLARKVRDE